MIYKDIILFQLNKPTRDGTIYTLESINLPKEPMPLTDNFDFTKIVGTAFNFRFDKDNLICDIDTDKNISTIAPGYNIDYKEGKSDGFMVLDAKLINVSSVTEHNIEELNNNLGGKDE